MALNEQSSTAARAAKNLTIALVGGGSGGHITPLLTVGEELKKLNSEATLIFIGQKGEKLIDAVQKNSNIDRVHSVRAGKFRRYHGEGIKQLLDLKTMLKNIRDFFYFLAGIWQSYWLLKRIKPDGIFIKGGFVGVPVGLAAAMQKIPYITHDSDALPGLANRIISRWAAAHAVGLPKDVYSYPEHKTFTTGVPISLNFQPVNEALQASYKKKANLPSNSQVLFVTGGGNGAERINDALVYIAQDLLSANPKLIIVHATGLIHEKTVNNKYSQALLDSALLSRVIAKGFFVDLYLYSGAADVVVTRAGATNLAEFAAQHKACVIVPNPVLTGGHQLKNAKYLVKQKAAVIVNDNDLPSNPDKLKEAVQEILNNKQKQKELGKNLGTFAKPRAAKELAELLVETINIKNKKTKNAWL